MPQRDGKGPSWGSGPGTGRRHGQFDSVKKDTISNKENKSQSLIAIVGSTIALISSFVKLFSLKKQDEKKDIDNKG